MPTTHLHPHSAVEILSGNFARPLRGESPFLAERTLLSPQLKLIPNLLGLTFRAGGNRLQGIHHEFMPTRQAEVRGVVPDALGKQLMLRMVSILLLPVLVVEIRIPVIPGLDDVLALTTGENI
jgi:hypothetical protein